MHSIYLFINPIFYAYYYYFILFKNLTQLAIIQLRVYVAGQRRTPALKLPLWG